MNKYLQLYSIGKDTVFFCSKCGVFSGIVKFFQKIFFLVLFINVFATQGFSENQIYEFGPETKHTAAFAAFLDENGADTNSTAALNKYADFLKHNPPSMRVIVAILDNDPLDIPEIVSVNHYANTKQLAAKLYEYAAQVVFLLEDGKKDCAEIITGGNRRVCPSWLFAHTLDALTKNNVPTQFETYRMQLYRLGIISGNMLLNEFLYSKIPAIKVKTNADITPVLTDLLKNYEEGIPEDYDRHFLVKKFWGKVHIFSEKFLMLMIIFVIIAGLFFIFMFDFVIGKKREQHIFALLKLWWIPFIFLLFTVCTLFISGKAVSFFFYLRFGSQQAFEILPITAVLLKYIFTLFFITIFMFLSRLAEVYRSQFVYGYIVSFICLINVFLFSIIDFSFAALYLEIYIISFFYYRFKNLLIQIVFTVLLVLPFLPYIAAANDTGALAKAVFTGSNILQAMNILPLAFSLNRIFLQAIRKIDKKTKKALLFFSIPIMITGFFSFIFIILIFTVPAWTKKSPLELLVHQKIKKNSISTNITGHVRIKNDINVLWNKQKVKDFCKEGVLEDRFINLKTSVTHDSERHLVEAVINSPVKILALEILIESEFGFPVYEAGGEFQLKNGNKTAQFLLPSNPVLPFFLSFTSPKNIPLTITVRAWSAENIFKTEIISKKQPYIRSKFILEIEKKHSITAAEERRL